MKLGIKAANCYGALDGEPVLEVMERRTVSAMNDLMNTELNIEDGSMAFKEKFSEISRFGSKIINYDQTFQLLRNNDLKANVRHKASQAMLLQLLALKSNEEKEQGEQEESSLRHATASPHTSVHDADDMQSTSSLLSKTEKLDEIDIDIETSLSKGIM